MKEQEALKYLKTAIEFYEKRVPGHEGKGEKSLLELLISLEAIKDDWWEHYCESNGGSLMSFQKVNECDWCGKRNEDR